MNYAVITSASLFALMAIIHLMRLLTPFPVIIGTFSVPIWMSGVIFILSSMLSAWLFRSARQ